jgi:hypothetical protein
MAKNRKQKKSKKSNRKINTNSAYASLCAIAPVIKALTLQKNKEEETKM